MKKTMVKQLITIVFILFSLATFAQTADVAAFKVTVTGKGQPMLFIPGATCSGDEWQQTVAHYSKSHECHVFTLAGYAGQPALAKPPYLDTYKEQIINYIKNNHLDNVILVGHSIGGFLALSIAAEMKGHLQKVIIVDALPFFAGVRDSTAKGGFNEDNAKQQLDYYNKMDDAQLRESQLKIAGYLCADSTKWSMIAGWGAKSDRKTMAYSMNEMLGDDKRQAIAAIQVPVLVMAAFAPVPQYLAFTKENVLATYQQQYRQCKTCRVDVTPSSKHFIMYDATDWYFQEIDNFISKS